MSKTQAYVRAIFKWIIAALAAGNLIALFVFNYDIPVISQFFLGDSSAISGQSTGGSNDSGSDTTPLTAEESDASENESASEDTQNSSDSETESDLSSISSAKSGETDAESENSAVSPVISVADDLPTFKTSELSLIVDLLIDQNLLRADDGYGNDVTYDVTGEISEGSSAGEYLLTLNLTNEEGSSTSVTVTIQTSD